MEEFKDRRLKYANMPRVFSAKASEIDISCKQHLRACAKLASFLAQQKPKSGQDFERNEWLKDFVMKSAQLNEQTIALLAYLKDELQEVSNDAKALIDGAKLLDQVRDQSDTIEMLQRVRDEGVIKTYEQRKNYLRQNKAITQ
jgi:hypothetical protein